MADVLIPLRTMLYKGWNVADLLLDQVAAVLSLPTRRVLCYSLPPCCATRQEA